MEPQQTGRVRRAHRMQSYRRAVTELDGLDLGDAHDESMNRSTDGLEGPLVPSTVGPRPYGRTLQAVEAAKVQIPPSSEAEPLGLVEVDRNGLEILEAAECERLLASSTFGRIGVTYAALPVILPINYRYVDGSIIFRTAAGAKLEAAACGSVVAFEVDSIDPLTHSGWSVIVTGVASPVTDVDELDRLEAAAVPRWAPFGEDRFVALPLQMVSGRRLEPRAQPSGDGR